VAEGTAAAERTAARPDTPARLDGLLAEAARRLPERVAIAVGEREVTFAALDRQVSAWAGQLRELLTRPEARSEARSDARSDACSDDTRPDREPGVAVAVASVLDPDFAAAYYAVSRAGHVAAVVNPLMREEGLLHVLTLCGARAALVDAATYARLEGLRDRLPQLRHLVPIGPAEGEVPPGARRFADQGPRLTFPAVDPDDVVCVQFTSGTTGAPKGVRLTHRNLTVNADQIARAQLLDETSIAVNHLPTYHPMHLNSAVRAGATQVLCTAPEAPAAVRVANRSRATHLYSLPVRLARLAAAPAEEVPAPETLRWVGSGGSALPAAAARRLTERLGVPVFQGYGLAETAPLTHCDDPEDPRPGTVGRPVHGTECRVVDPDTRAVLPAGAAGEVELRGPQVMKGYLGRPDGSATDAEGWFATGDIGRIDDTGRLVVVDRSGDVFKCDNFLVAPSEVEPVLQRHPLVREAVVLGLPDGLGGAQAAALLVLAPGASAAEVVARVNQDLPYYQRIRHAEAVEAIPRSANGKIQRRDLRDRFPTWRASHAADPFSEGTPVFTVVNTFTLKNPAEAEEFERRFTEHVQWMRAQDGFLDHQAVRRTEDTAVYVNIGWWRSPDHFRRVLADPVFQAHAAEFHKVVDVVAAPSMSVARTDAEVLPDSAEPVLLVEEFTPREGAAGTEAFERAWEVYAESLAKAEGFGHADLARSVAGPAYTALTWWADAEALRAAQAGPAYLSLLDLAEAAAHPATPVTGTRTRSDAAR